MIYGKNVIFYAFYISYTERRIVVDNRNIINPMLDLVDRPAFCVQDGIIIQVNAAARQRQITEDMQISALLVMTQLPIKTLQAARFLCL